MQTQVFAFFEVGPKVEYGRFFSAERDLDAIDVLGAFAGQAMDAINSVLDEVNEVTQSKTRRWRYLIQGFCLLLHFFVRARRLTFCKGAIDRKQEFLDFAGVALCVAQDA